MRACMSSSTSSSSQVRGDQPERDDAGHLGGVLGVVGRGHAAHQAHEQRDVGEAQEDERHHVRQHQLVHQSGIGTGSHKTSALSSQLKVEV